MAETGFHSIQGVIDKKRILQAHRVKAEKRYTMIKRVTQSDGSIWKQNTIKIMEKYGLDEEILNLKKDNLNKLIKMKIAEKEAKDIEQETKEKSKVKHWMELTTFCLAVFNELCLPPNVHME